MNQQTFLEQLRQGFSGLPQEEIEARLAFYSEMIDDQMEDGISEEDAVSSVGSVEDIVAQAVEEVPLAKIARERIRPKKPLRWVEILLLVLGSPIWLSLGIAVLAVLLRVSLPFGQSLSRCGRCSPHWRPLRLRRWRGA